MTTYFVTRHAGAADWARQNAMEVIQISHLDIAKVQAGDVVIGSLPVHIAAHICAKDARYVHLAIDVPENHRGHELTAKQMTEFGASLQEFWIEKRSAYGQ